MEAGTDEVGRGPLAGPVVAAAVILPAAHGLVLRDSKKLTPKRRAALAEEIEAVAIATAIAVVPPAIIDEINILQASLLAMQQAVTELNPAPTSVLVDGNQLPSLIIPAKAIVGGDDLVPCISAASILAKVKRDNIMIALAEKYPGYGFEQHKGYPTKTHLEALRSLGVTPMHRRSFAPVARLLKEETA